MAQDADLIIHHAVASAAITILVAPFAAANGDGAVFFTEVGPAPRQALMAGGARCAIDRLPASGSAMVCGAVFVVTCLA